MQEESHRASTLIPKFVIVKSLIQSKNIKKKLQKGLKGSWHFSGNEYKYPKSGS